VKRENSWIFGVYSKAIISNEKLNEIENLLPQTSLKSINPNCSIYFASGKNTFYNLNSKWIINGVGLLDTGSKYKLMSQEDWENYFVKPESFNLSGHFLKIHWSDSRLTITNDKLGLKTIFYFEVSNEVYFSTNLKLLLRFLPNSEINLTAFGSKWLLFNPLNYNSFIQRIKKLLPNSELSIVYGKIKVKSEEYVFELNKYTTDQFFSELNKLVNIEIQENYKISFGLSGGLDSRLLLALFYTSKRDFDIHSFGFGYEADVEIASELAKKLNLKHNILVSDLNDKSLIDSIPDYISNNELAEPASTYLRLYKLNDEYFNNKIMLDGANGEIYRRQFLNRLYYAGKSSISNKNVDKIFSALNFNRADIFKNDIKQVLFDGARNEISERLNKMPDVNTIGFENYLDLLNIKTRFINYFGPEQMRLDSFITSLMPYINDNILKNVFGLSLKGKRNSKIYIDYLRKIGGAFTSTSLVKGDITYPFGLSKIQVAFYTKIKNRFKRSSQKSPIVEFYYYQRDYIKNILLDKSTLDYHLYDKRKIEKIVNDFYSGNRSKVKDLDWLVSFELFRRELKLQ
jgi:hypothetical protein